MLVTFFCTLQILSYFAPQAKLYHTFHMHASHEISYSCPYQASNFPSLKQKNTTNCPNIFSVIHGNSAEIVYLSEKLLTFFQKKW